MHNQLIALVCIVCVMFGSFGKFFDITHSMPSVQKEIRMELLNKEEKSIYTHCTLFVNGKELKHSGYVAVDNDKRFALIPLVPVLERLDVQFEWINTNIANIKINGEKYVLDVFSGSFKAEKSNINLILLAPGTQHETIIERKDGIMLVDSDSLQFIIYNIIGARISINYDDLIISIDYLEQ